MLLFLIVYPLVYMLIIFWAICKWYLVISYAFAAVYQLDL